MFIETESTPNPATLKFIPGREVMGARGTADFPGAEAAARSPLASRIFALPGVARRRRRHRVPRLPRRRGAPAPPGRLLGLPLLARHPEARRREHAAALR